MIICDIFSWVDVVNLLQLFVYCQFYVYSDFVCFFLPAFFVQLPESEFLTLVDYTAVKIVDNSQTSVCRQACNTQIPLYGLKQRHRLQFRLLHYDFYIAPPEVLPGTVCWWSDAPEVMPPPWLSTSQSSLKWETLIADSSRTSMQNFTPLRNP